MKHGNFKHGLHDIIEYQTWKRMRQRCHNPNNHLYPTHGKRGIKICKEWDDFTVFYLDMGKRPSSKHSIDRIDNDGDYEPDNCRWATPSEQQKNRRPFVRNKAYLITIDGVTLTARQWCDKIGLNYGTFISRVNRGGKSPSEAIAIL